MTLGPYLPADGGRLELPGRRLPRSLSPGESAEVDRPHPSCQRRRAPSEIAIDAVREGIAWFADYGSSPLVVAIPGDD